MRNPGITITNPHTGTDTSVPWNGGTGMFGANGTFNGATIKLQHKVGATLIDLGDAASFAATGAVIFTTAAPELNVNVANGSNTQGMKGVVLPVNENKAY